jgi:hypothetical protein
MTTSKNLEISELARKLTIDDHSGTISGIIITPSTLADTGVTSGEYGSASQVPVLTINAKGQITSASTTSVAGVSAVTYTDSTKTLNIATADGGSFDAQLTNLATETYVNSAITSLVDSSPSTLDTLNELATALGDDPNFATTVTTALGTKATITQLDDLQTLLENYVNARLPAGSIIMWSGSIASIPTGWALCDGTNSTPNLIDRFVISAGNLYSVNSTGGSKDAIVVSHTHTADHSHSGSTNEAGGHRHYLVRNSNTNQYSQYGISLYTDNYIAGSGSGGYETYYLNGHTSEANVALSSSAGAHSHSVTVNSASVTTSSTGSSATNANLPPYYALAFIMKL